MRAPSLLGACLLLISLPAAALPLRLMFETVANEGPGDELAFVTYDTFADLLAGNLASSQFSQVDVSGNFDTTGITYDGDDFIVMFETVANEGPGDELAFVTYDTFADLLAGNLASSQFSQVDVSGNFDTTGITYDGDDFIVMFETVANEGPGDELAFVTYDTFADLLAGNLASSQFSQVDVSGNFDTTGITYDGDDFIVMFETVANEGPGDELAFVTYDTFADLLAGNLASSQFSQVDVSGNFNTTGLVLEPNPGGAGTRVPAPGTLALMLAAFAIYRRSRCSTG